MLILNKLLNHCFGNSYVPEFWLTFVIIPVLKGKEKDPYVISNYSGISLMSCVAKVYSGILNNRVVNFLDRQNIIV